MAAQKPHLMGIGNPLLDVSAEVDESVLSKYGLKNADAILAEEKHMPLFDELQARDNVLYIPGGACQNSFRGFQWMMQAPQSSTFLGCVGKDSNGERLREHMQKDGVDVMYLETEEEATGRCACCIVEQDRSMVAHLGAANLYKHAHWETPEVQARLEQATFFYTTGFFLTVSPETLVAFGKHAAATGKPFLMNLSAPFIPQFFFDAFKSVLPYVDVLIGNELEMKALAEKVELDASHIRSVAQWVVDQPKEAADRPRRVIFTQGADPVYTLYKGEVHEYKIPPIPKEEQVDYNGAGDAFVGGYLAGLAKGASEETAVRAGMYTAGKIIRVSGNVYSGTPDFAW